MAGDGCAGIATEPDIGVVPASGGFEASEDDPAGRAGNTESGDRWLAHPATSDRTRRRTKTPNMVMEEDQRTTVYRPFDFIDPAASKRSSHQHESRPHHVIL